MQIQLPRGKLFCWVVNGRSAVTCSLVNRYTYTKEEQITERFAVTRFMLPLSGNYPFHSKSSRQKPTGLFTLLTSKVARRSVTVIETTWLDQQASIIHHSVYRKSFSFMGINCILVRIHILMVLKYCSELAAYWIT